MKLSSWAKKAGISYMTAWRWWRDGKLPVNAYQTATGTVIVEDEVSVAKPSDGEAVAIYARVSSSDQAADLDRQVGRLTAFATKNGLTVSKTVTEIGSGLNGNRPKLKKLLGDASVKTVLVEHRDRLARFGFEYIEAGLNASGRKVLTANATETSDDLVRDMTEVLTSLCARLYGRRSAKNKAERALASLEEQSAE